jgi:hypothetical protein
MAAASLPSLDDPCVECVDRSLHDDARGGWSMQRMSCAENAIRHNMMCCEGMVLHDQEKMLQTDVPLPSPKKTFDSSKFLRDASVHRKEVHQLPRVERKGFGWSLGPEEVEGGGSGEDWHSTSRPPAGSASEKTDCNWDGSSGRKRGIGSRIYAAFSRKGSQLAGKLRMPGQQQQECQPGVARTRELMGSACCS